MILEYLKQHKIVVAFAEGNVNDCDNNIKTKVRILQPIAELSTKLNSDVDYLTGGKYVTIIY